MSVTYTATLGSIYNYPVPIDWSLVPSDFTISETTATTIQAETGDYVWPQWPEEGSKRYIMSFGGEFSFAEDLVGENLANATDQIISDGIENWSITTFNSEGTQTASESTVYDEPIDLAAFFSDWAGRTFDEIAAEYSGDDSFRGAINQPDDDAIHGHDGNDRFTMTYGDNYSDKFNGGDGFDTAILPSARKNWVIESALVWDEVNQSQTLDGFTVTDQTRSEGNTLEITNVERLEFTNSVLELEGRDWVVADMASGQPISSETTTPAAPGTNTPTPEVTNAGPITSEPGTSNVPIGTHSLTVIADIFGSIVFLKDLTEVVTSSSHTIYHAGSAFDYEAVDSFVTTVVRNGEFTSEFQAEIIESFPAQANIDYSTAVALIGRSNMDSTLLAVAGADGNYTG